MLDVGLIQGLVLVLPAGCPALLYKSRGVSPAPLTIPTWKGGQGVDVKQLP